MAYRRRGFDDHRRSDGDDHPSNGRRSPSWEGQARNQDVDERRKRRDDREEGRSEERDRDDRRSRGDRDRDRSRSRSKDRERRRRRSSEGDDEDRDRSDRERRRGSPGDRSGRDRSSRRRRGDRSRSRSPGRGDRNLRSEWYCRCGALNFKRRTTCFRQFCGAQRSDVPPPGTNIPDNYAAEDIPGLAAYSAQLYAKSPQERAQYLAYYTNYFSRQLAARPSEADKVNEAAAVAQSAISQVQARTAPVVAAAASALQPPVLPETPTGTDNRIYRVPDTSAYVYDQTSGFYYDPSTSLYYDANTHYYYNSQSGQYLYWDASRMTYVLAATAQTATAVPTAVPANTATSMMEGVPTEAKKPAEKQDKVKVAKKIAKDMERWARTLNNKKEAARAGATAEAAAAAGAPSGSADIGFTVLEARPVAAAPLLLAAPLPPALVPSYGAGSDSSDDEEDSILDRSKLACLLCKRQFPSAEILDKHVEMSDLHRKNLEVWKKKSGERSEAADSYRDRAAERRMKYGEEEPPPLPKQRKSAQARDGGAESAVPREIGEDNVGKKLLKKMGWSAGQGLGRDGSGRVAPVEARPGQTGAGLGQKRSIYTAVVGETYRSCVRKLTVARYQDLLSTEDNP